MIYEFVVRKMSVALVQSLFDVGFSHYNSKYKESVKITSVEFARKHRIALVDYLKERSFLRLKKKRETDFDIVFFDFICVLSFLLVPLKNDCFPYREAPGVMDFFRSAMKGTPLLQTESGSKCRAEAEFNKYASPIFLPYMEEFIRDCIAAGCISNNFGADVINRYITGANILGCMKKGKANHPRFPGYAPKEVQKYKHDEFVDYLLDKYGDYLEKHNV